MKGGSREASNWMSLADLMTGLMMVFMLVAVTFMRQQTRQTIRFREYAGLQDNLYQDLQSALKEIKEVEVKPDLSIVISEDGFSFDSGDDELKPEFREMLDLFYRSYLKVLLKDDYRPFIKEVRIEGHTDRDRYRAGESKNPFISNVELSQDRSRHVLEYLWQTEDFRSISKEEMRVLEYWFTANGLSYGRMVDSSGRLVHRLGAAKEQLQPDDSKSRRVEFRIVTNAANLIDEYNNKNYD